MRLSNKKQLTVTQPHLPALEEFLPYLEEIWASKNLTNFGQFHQQLEQALSIYLAVPHVSLFCNGTLALITALRALGVTGKVITTPYSFVATAHALLWSGLEPVFVDIDAATMTLAPAKVEAAITPETSAILPVHIHGRPCQTAALAEIARRHDLKLIYDAAQVFSVRDDNGSITRHGDLSILSFHATKVFSSFEGGAIICHDDEMKTKLDYMKNFGFENETTVSEIGINGKMSEIQAAFGLLQLKHLGEAHTCRAEIDDTYRQQLAGVNGIAFPDYPAGFRSNFWQFPIFVQTDYPLSRDQLYNRMREQGIMARRYFYPLIIDFPMYRQYQADVPVARKIAAEVLCLPIHSAMSNQDVDMVISCITE